MVRAVESDKVLHEIGKIKNQMWWVNWCPFAHWIRNNSRTTNYFYYRLVSALDGIEVISHKITAEIKQDLHSSKNSFDRLYGIVKALEKIDVNQIQIKQDDDAEFINSVLNEKGLIKKIVENKNMVSMIKRFYDETDQAENKEYLKFMDCFEKYELIENDDLRIEVKKCLGDKIKEELLYHILKKMNTAKVRVNDTSIDFDIELQG